MSIKEKLMAKWFVRGMYFGLGVVFILASQSLAVAAVSQEIATQVKSGGQETGNKNQTVFDT